MCLCLVVAHSHRFWSFRFFTPFHSYIACFWSTHPVFLLLFPTLCSSLFLSHTLSLSLSLVCFAPLQFIFLAVQYHCKTNNNTTTFNYKNWKQFKRSCSTSNSCNFNNISNSNVHTPLAFHLHTHTHTHTRTPARYLHNHIYNTLCGKFPKQWSRIRCSMSCVYKV